MGEVKFELRPELQPCEDQGRKFPSRGKVCAKALVILETERPEWLELVE